MTDAPRYVPPVPFYSLIETSRGEDPAIVVVNTALRTYSHRDHFPWHLSIVITCELLAENGMPTMEEVEALERVESKISDRLLTNANAVFLARVTCRRVRELSYRVHDPELTDVCLKNLVSDPAPLRHWEYGMQFDSEWAFAERELSLIERHPGIN